jgi:hypothetical protein
MAVYFGHGYQYLSNDGSALGAVLRSLSAGPQALSL